MTLIILYFFIGLLAINYEKIKNIKYIDLLVFTLFTVFFSIRWEVGGDWGTYLNYYLDLGRRDPFHSPLFLNINLFSNLTKIDYLGKNTIEIIIFLIPIFYFLKKLETNFYLYLCVAYPIIIMVYGIGSVRQGLAIAYFSAFLLYDGNRFVKFSLSIIPIFFHNTAIFIVLFYYATQVWDKINFRNAYVNLISICAIVFLTFILFQEQIDLYIRYYVYETTYDSKGAFIRTTLLVFLCMAFLFNMKKFTIEKKLKNFMFFSSIFIICCLPLSIFFSTPIDRILGYFMILKILIIYLFIKNIRDEKIKSLATNSVVCFFFILLTVWMYFGANSIFWLRYDNYFTF